MNKLLLFCRVADFFTVLFTTTIPACGSSDLFIQKWSEIPGTNVSEEHSHFLLVAKRMTLVSIYYELIISLSLIFTISCCIICTCCAGYLGCICVVCACMKGYKALRPFIIFDCFFIILLGPFGNVYLFLLGCAGAYVVILFRIGFYLSIITLPAAFSYFYRQKDNPDPNAGSFKSFLPILLTLGLKFASCSSCLATFLNIAYPEALAVRITYLVFTILIGLFALITYYETLLKLLEVVKDWVEKCTPFHSCKNHFTFWPSMLANLGLLGLNSYILYKYHFSAGPTSPAVSLGLNILALAYIITNYVFRSEFCGHGPLHKVCSQRCSSNKDS